MKYCEKLYHKAFAMNDLKNSVEKVSSFGFIAKIFLRPKFSKASIKLI